MDPRDMEISNLRLALTHINSLLAQDKPMSAWLLTRKALAGHEYPWGLDLTPFSANVSPE